jgi:hypothetical protein
MSLGLRPQPVRPGLEGAFLAFGGLPHELRFDRMRAVIHAGRPAAGWCARPRCTGLGSEKGACRRRGAGIVPLG